MKKEKTKGFKWTGWITPEVSVTQMTKVEFDSNYIDLTSFNLFEKGEISLTRMRNALDAYDSSGMPKGVRAILLTERQYRSYQNVLCDFIYLLSQNLGEPDSLPNPLRFNGISCYIKT